MTAIRAEVNAGGAVADLLAIADRAQDFTPVWEGAGTRALLGMFTDIWATEGESIGAKWAPLSPVTEALKARAGRSRMGTLRMFDTLYRSLTVRSGANQIREVTPDSLTLGTSATNAGFPYPAALHHGWASNTIFGRARQSGADATRLSDRAGLKVVNVPGRKIIPDDLPATVRSTLEDALATYITTGTA